VHFGKGSCKVSVYSPTQALPYYRLCFRVGGRRCQRTRKTFEEAEESAKVILSQLREGRVSVAQITQQDVSILGFANSELAELGLRLDQAIYEYADARRRLGGVALSEAVKCYLQYHPTSLRQINLEELVKRFLDYKQDSGVSDAYLNDLEFRLRSLVAAFDCSVDQLRQQGVAEYFKRLNFAPENHTNQLRVVRTLFNYAKGQGYLPESADLLKGVPKKKIIRGNYAIYQPSEFHALLRAASVEMKPGLALLGLCGVRPAEMRRLVWSDVRIESGTLIVNASGAKTASRRTVPLRESAIMCLSQFKGSEGPIWRRKSDYWSKALNRLHREVGVKQLPNGLRHSYISYRLTLTGDVNRTALEAGNSAAMIHRHYHALVDDPKLAEEWFDVGVRHGAAFCKITA
jgi:integrase